MKKNVELNQNLWGEKDEELEGSEGVFEAESSDLCKSTKICLDPQIKIMAK